jgi:hypothetical protein
MSDKFSYKEAGFTIEPVTIRTYSVEEKLEKMHNDIQEIKALLQPKNDFEVGATICQHIYPGVFAAGETPKCSKCGNVYLYQGR